MNKMMDNFGKQAENFNSIDVMKFIMAIVVVAIHTEPFHSSQHNVQIAFNALSGLAVPFFFISSGFLLGRRMQDDSDVFPAKRQLIKIIKLYVKWSVIYLPFAIYDYWHTGISPLKAAILYIRNFILGGMHYNSWQLWYLLSTIYGLLFIIGMLKYGVSNRLRKLLIIAIAFTSLLLSYIVSILADSSTPFWLAKLGTVIEKTILNGRILQGLYYIPIGIVLSKSKEMSKKAIFLTICLSMLFRYCCIGNKFWADVFLIPASIGLFEIVRKIKMSDDKHIYQSMRSMSTIIYLIHMWVWTAVYTVIYHEKTFGLLCFMGTAGISIFIAFVYEKNVVTKH